MAYDAIVIGGGVIGLSVAWRLGERGMRVLLAERSTLGAGTSGRGVGGVRQQFTTPINIALSQLSLPVFVALGERIGWRQHGYLYLALSDAMRGTLWARAEMQRAHDVAVELLEPDEARARFPYVRADDVRGAAFGALDGYLDPALLLPVLAEGARSAGVVIAEGMNVTAIVVAGNRVTGVETGAGAFVAPAVVNAAGPWAAQVAALAGVDLPVVPLKRQVWLTESTTAASPTAPLTIDADTGWHFRPREGALCLAMSGGEAPGDENLALDPVLADRMLEGARHRLPALDVGLARGWAGLYEVTPDAHPIVGAAPVRGLFLACGFSGHGLMHSPAIGLLLAAAICGDTLPIDIAPLALDRFARGALLGEGGVL